MTAGLVKKYWPWLFAAALASRLLLLAAFNGQWAILGSFAHGSLASQTTHDDVVLAQNILAHGGLTVGRSPDANMTDGIRPTAFWSPGQPYFYSLIMRLFPGGWLTAIQIIQSVLAAAAFVFFALFFESLFGPLAALIAFLLMNASPFLGTAHIIYNNTSSALFLSGLLFVLFGRLARAPAWRTGLAAGIVFGALLLVNAGYVAFGLAVVLWLGWRPKSTWKYFFFCGGVAVLLLAPWIARNYMIFGKFIPLRSSYKNVFWVGNNPRATGSFLDAQGIRILPDEQMETAMAGMNELERGDFLFDQSKGFIRENPGRFAALRLKTWGYFWTTSAYWTRRPLPAARKILWVLTLAMVAAAAAGALAAIKDKIPLAGFLTTGLLIFGALYALCHADVYERYRLCLDPLLLGFAAYLFSKCVPGRGNFPTARPGNNA
jgi:hypothetical protein